MKRIHAEQGAYGFYPTSRGLTHQRLLDVLSYDRETGIFVWKVNLSKRPLVGHRAGIRRLRQIAIGLDGRYYMAHHLAWFYVTGEWPSGLIDHRDLNPYNNRFENLRIATPSQNGANRRRFSNNTTGFKGVTKVGGGLTVRYKAKIKVNYKDIYLGSFDDKEAAHQAYVTAAKLFFGPYARAA